MAATLPFPAPTPRLRRPDRACLRRDRQLFARYADRAEPVDHERLMQRFLPLARRLAMRYHTPPHELEDLLQVASVGLLKAIDRYDYTRGIAFSSYAVPTISGELMRYFRDSTWPLHLPRDLRDFAVTVDRVHRELSARLQRAPSTAELAERLGVEEDEVLEARQAASAYRMGSLDAPRCDDAGSDETVADRIGRDDRGFDRAEDRATLIALMRHLTPRDRAVLRLRYEQDLTQREIGERVGLSQMQVSRILRDAIERLRLAVAA